MMIHVRAGQFYIVPLSLGVFNKLRAALLNCDIKRIKREESRVSFSIFFFIYIFIYILTRDILLIARVLHFTSVEAGDAYYFSAEISMLSPVKPHAGGYWRPCSRWKVKLFSCLKYFLL